MNCSEKLKLSNNIAKLSKTLVEPMTDDLMREVVKQIDTSMEIHAIADHVACHVALILSLMVGAKEKSSPNAGGQP